MELLISLVTVFANLILGLFTYLKNPKSSTNRLLAFLTLQVSVWAIANYFSLHSHTIVENVFCTTRLLSCNAASLIQVSITGLRTSSKLQGSLITSFWADTQPITNIPKNNNIIFFILFPLL